MATIPLDFGIARGAPEVRAEPDGDAAPGRPADGALQPAAGVEIGAKWPVPVARRGHGSRTFIRHQAKNHGGKTLE